MTEIVKRSCLKILMCFYVLCLALLLVVVPFRRVDQIMKRKPQAPFFIPRHFYHRFRAKDSIAYSKIQCANNWYSIVSCVLFVNELVKGSIGLRRTRQDPVPKIGKKIFNGTSIVYAWKNMLTKQRLACDSCARRQSGHDAIRYANNTSSTNDSSLESFYYSSTTTNSTTTQVDRTEFCVTNSDCS